MTVHSSHPSSLVCYHYWCNNFKTLHFVDTKSAADEGVLTPKSSSSPHENTNSALSISTPISIASNEEK